MANGLTTRGSNVNSKLQYWLPPKQVTPNGIVELDLNMLLMKNRVMLSKLTYVGKVMTKSTNHNMCRRALRNGKNGKDLLTECEDWCRDLDIPNVTKGCLDTNLIKRQS